MVSRVVPETGDTIALFSLSKLFNIELFPAFGLPTIAIFTAPSSSSLSDFRSISFVIKSNKSPTPPEPWRADTA